MCTTPASRHGLVHRPHFAGVQPERLLAHDVLAVLGRGQGDRLMGEVGRGDDDGVDVGIGAEGLGVGRDVVDPPLGLRRSSSRVGVAGADQLGPRVELDRGHVVIVADRPGADRRPRRLASVCLLCSDIGSPLASRDADRVRACPGSCLCRSVLLSCTHAPQEANAALDTRVRRATRHVP